MQEQSFDMEDYVKQRLLEIGDTDERSFAKEALLKGFLPAIQVMEKRYRDLEERIRREIEIPGSRYAVYTTVIRRQDYDAANRTWFPVCEDDVGEDGTVCSRIYFRGNRGDRENFEKHSFFNAVDSKGQPRQVGIKRTEDYRNAVEELYHLFVCNRVPWHTVNTGDLDRFYDVCPMEETEDAENLNRWEIDFGEWQDVIDRDYMALWNLEYFTFRSMKFMVPSVDGKYYEHELNLKEYEPDCGYMVKGNKDILSIRHESGRILMISPREAFESWQACRFGRRQDTDSFGYHHRILGNGGKERFADHLAARYGQGIHSRTELFRIAEELDADSQVRLRDSQIREKEQEGSYPADMNWFLREDLFPMETRKVLELTFERRINKAGMEGNEAIESCDPDGEDMLRYVISQIQLLFDEYRCVGRLA